MGWKTRVQFSGAAGDSFNTPMSIMVVELTQPMGSWGFSHGRQRYKAARA